MKKELNNELKLWDKGAILNNESLVCVALEATGETVVSIEQTEYDTFIADLDGYEEEYRVFNSYEEAESVAVEEILNTLKYESLSSMGLLDFAIREGLVDYEWFKDALCETYESIAWDEDIEYIVDNWDEDTMDEDEERQKYYDCMVASIGDCAEDFYNEYCYQFGMEHVENLINQYDLVDLDELAETVVRYDGAENTLATWDGNYFEENGLYFFRIA